MEEKEKKALKATQAKKSEPVTEKKETGAKKASPKKEAKMAAPEVKTKAPKKERARDEKGKFIQEKPIEAPKKELKAEMKEEVKPEPKEEPKAEPKEEVEVEPKKETKAELKAEKKAAKKAAKKSAKKAAKKETAPMAVPSASEEASVEETPEEEKKQDVKVNSEKDEPEEEDAQVEMAKAPDLRVRGKGGKKDLKKFHLFSQPLFTESVKSNRVMLGVSAGGNAIIMILIILILSTLHINATSDAMKDLFNNADTESTVKMGAISYYSGFTNTATAYLTYEDTDSELTNTVSKSVDVVNSDSTKNQLTGVKAAYDASYRVASGDDSAKQSTAKGIAMSAADAVLNSDTSLSEQERLASHNIVSSYLDYYIKDSSSDMTTLLKKAVPVGMSNTLASLQGLNEKETQEVLDVWNNAFDLIFNQSKDQQTVCTGTSLDLIPILAKGDTAEFADMVTSDLKAAYDADTSLYMADSSVKSNILSKDCQSYILDTLSEYAYYNYLPDFTVDYVTSDLGYPIAYVGTGTYAENGNEIMKEVEVKSYNPDVYVEVKGDMGTTSTMVEKMHKEIITGEPYTDEEITEAKEESQSDIELLKGQIDSFMNDFLKRDEDGKNAYFDGTSLIDDAVSTRSVSLVSDAAEQALIESYNDKHDVKITSIAEITAKNSSMDGTKMMDLVRGYASSGIASYKTHLYNAKQKDYSDSDAMLIATVKASQGVIDQLPAGVNSSLSEMGEMNTYGIIVGVVAFGMATLLIPMVHSILLANTLVCQKVETGSLAFTLSTPTTRQSFVFTEACYMMYEEFVMAAALFLGTTVARAIGIACGGTDLITSLPMDHVAYYAFGNFMVSLAISGITFLSSCIFNKSNKAIGVGGGITIFFFICSILGLFGTEAIPGTVRIDGMKIFNYMTIDSLFDPLAVMHGDMVTYWWKLAILLGITLVTYAVGMVRFDHKDLPL